MKKLLAILLVLTMVIGTGIMVSAVEQGTKVTFIKKVAGGGNPAETFNFEVIDKRVVEGSATEAPLLVNFEIDVAKGASQGTTEVNLPSFTKVGRYEYDIKEVVGNTAGMDYDANIRTLVVIVTNKEGGGFEYNFGMKDEEEKSNDFTVANNTFNSGNLEINKTVTGNLGDKDQYFGIQVVLEGPEGKNVNAEVNYSGGKYDSTIVTFDSNGKATLDLEIKHDDTIMISNLPHGVTYTVVEEELADYDQSGEVTEPVAIGEENKVKLVNDRGTNIDTGISLDNLPYIMTMALALGGLVLFVVRKRRLN